MEESVTLRNGVTSQQQWSANTAGCQVWPGPLFSGDNTIRCDAVSQRATSSTRVLPVRRWVGHCFRCRQWLSVHSWKGPIHLEGSGPLFLSNGYMKGADASASTPSSHPRNHEAIPALFSPCHSRLHGRRRARPGRTSTTTPGDGGAWAPAPSGSDGGAQAPRGSDDRHTGQWMEMAEAATMARRNKQQVIMRRPNHQTDGPKETPAPQPASAGDCSLVCAAELFGFWKWKVLS